MLGFVSYSHCCNYSSLPSEQPQTEGKGTVMNISQKKKPYKTKNRVQARFCLSTPELNYQSSQIFPNLYFLHISAQILILSGDLYLCFPSVCFPRLLLSYFSYVFTCRPPHQLVNANRITSQPILIMFVSLGFAMFGPRQPLTSISK